MSLVGPPNPQMYANFQDTKQIKMMNITFKNSITISEHERNNNTGDYFFVESFGLGNITKNTNLTNTNT